MATYKLTRTQRLLRPRDVVFDFFANAENLEAITPPWLHFKIVTPTPIVMAVGAQIAYQIRWRFVRMSWLSEIVEWRPPYSFTDVQLRGPYSYWVHRHSFEANGDETIMRDEVLYGVPLGPLGALLHSIKIKRDLNAIFDYRAQRIGSLLHPHRQPAANGRTRIGKRSTGTLSGSPDGYLDGVD